jgi:hypothetical protein
VNLDWHRLKAVVIESDDWGLCAWSADDQAFRALADTPAFRSPAGRRYGGSTLESAADVNAIAALLGQVRGGDGFPPVWQANTIVGGPDYARLVPPDFAAGRLPVVFHPESPSRWRRPGLWDEIRAAIAAGVWWPELHGLHHLPEQAWLSALRQGHADARRAFEHQSPVCEAVESSGEHDPREPLATRTAALEEAEAGFRSLFGRPPRSLCPPDYRWDERLERDAERLGITVLQGKAEQDGVPLRRLRRAGLAWRWPNRAGARFYMPPRIAFEPEAGQPARAGAAAVHRAVRRAWRRGQPAVVSTHRANYVHLDAARAGAGRGALADLLHRLAGDGAVFLADFEVRDLCERAWSVRPIGDRGALVRYYGVPGEPVHLTLPAGVTGARAREGEGPDFVEVTARDGGLVARFNIGEYLLEWERT